MALVSQAAMGALNPVFSIGYQITEAIKIHEKQHKLNALFAFSDEFELPNLKHLHRYVADEDLIVYIAARRNSVSYDNCMDNIQEKLEKQFSTHSKIIIYPRSYHIDSKFSEYSDIDPETLNQGFEKVQKLGKGLGNLLKRDHRKS